MQQLVLFGMPYFHVHNFDIIPGTIARDEFADSGVFQRFTLANGHIADAMANNAIPVIHIDGGHMSETDTHGWCCLAASGMDGNRQTQILQVMVCNGESNVNVEPFLQTLVRTFQDMFKNSQVSTICFHLLVKYLLCLSGLSMLVLSWLPSSVLSCHAIWDGALC
jgi:hypothetical protein